MKVSIRDIARSAGVSSTTVSHAISGKRPVSPATLAKVTAAMEEFGYAPSRSARNLALGKTQIIGLLVPDIGNAFFAELTKGVERVASGGQYNVIIGNTGFDRARGLMHLEMIRSRAVDGVVYSAGSPFTDDEMSKATGGVPLVLVDGEIPGSPAPLVVSDNNDGGRLAAEHLLSLGHRHALVINAPRGLLSGQHRVEGFLAAWESGGGQSVRIAEGGFTADSGRDATRRNIREFDSGPLTAVFAVNDEMAIGALSEFRSRGIAVPGQVSVMGFDDIRSARDMVPTLTTVQQNVTQLGERAAELLLSILKTGQQPEASRITVPVNLVARESTALVPMALADETHAPDMEIWREGKDR